MVSPNRGITHVLFLFLWLSDNGGIPGISSEERTEGNRSNSGDSGVVSLTVRAQKGGSSAAPISELVAQEDTQIGLGQGSAWD